MSEVDVIRAQLKSAIDRTRAELLRLEGAYKALGKDHPLPKSVDDPIREVGGKPITLAQRIKKVIAKYKGGREFTVPDIERELLAQQTYVIPGAARGRIAMSLQDLKEEGVVKLVDRPGTGKQNLYALIE